MEYLCSCEGIGPTAERLEVVLCHILIPLFLHSAAVKNGSIFNQILINFFKFCIKIFVCFNNYFEFGKPKLLYLQIIHSIRKNKKFLYRNYHPS